MFFKTKGLGACIESIWKNPFEIMESHIAIFLKLKNNSHPWSHPLFVSTDILALPLILKKSIFDIVKLNFEFRGKHYC